MSERKIDLSNRLALLRINDDTRASIDRFRPVLMDELDWIIARFYRHIMSFPQGQRIIGDESRVPELARAQNLHWTRLFSCSFDDTYARSALQVGRSHLKAGVAPYLYIAGYNFFICELVKLATERFAGDLQLPSILTAVTRVISLDMDLALSVYTRELWRANMQGG